MALTSAGLRSGYLAIVVLALLLPLATVVPASTTLPIVHTVTTKQPIYQSLEVPAAGAYEVTVRQHHVDVVVSVVDTAYKTIFSVNAPIGREGIESFLVTKVTPRPIIVKIETHPDCHTGGQVSINFRPLEPAEIPALELFQKASETNTQPKRSAEAARLFRESADSMADNERKADALFAAGRLEVRLKNLELGRKLLHDAARHYEKNANNLQRAWSLNSLGLTYSRGGDWKPAENYFEKAYALHEQADYFYGMGVVTNNLCLIKHQRSELIPAIDCYRRAVDFFHAEGEIWEAANTLNNTGGAWLMQGEPQQAHDHFLLALQTAKEAGNSSLQTEIQKNMAQLLRRQGQYQEALSLYLEVLPEFREQENGSRVASTLNNIGFLYQALGDASRAGAYFREALPLRRQSGDRAGEIRTLNNLGATQRSSGDLQLAIGNHQSALAIAEDLADIRGKIVSRLHIAKSLIGAHKTDLARLEITTVIELATTAADLKHHAEALHLSGEIRMLEKDYQTAFQFFVDAAEMRAKQGLLQEQSTSLTAAADSAYMAGNFDTARATLNQALIAIESLRRSLLTPDLQASFLADARQAGELDIELTMARYQRENEITLAISGLEKAEAQRMRIFGTLLLEGRSQIRKGIDPELSRQIEEVSARLRFEASRKLRVNDESREQFKEQTHALLTELDNLEAKVRENFPGYAQLTETVVSTLPQLLADLPEDITVLQYALGKRRSWLWIYGQDSFDAIEIKDNTLIDAAALDVYTRLSRLDPGDRQAIQRKLRDLAGIIIKPALPLITSQKLYIVADGSLHFVPFAALPIDDSDTPMMLNYELSYLPSLTVAAQLADRALPASPMVTVFADPAYGIVDGPARLTASAKEAGAIAENVPAANLHVALGYDARRDVLQSGIVASSDIVHIAAHGIYDQNNPSLSGIALAMVDADGVEIDGFVGLSDVYNLELNAGLVVLSGCQTALGKTVRGEGLVGLTRGFMYAGSPRVIASLWQVQDRATAAFMRQLYNGLLSEGLSPAAALRLAQRNIRADRRWRHPYFWAGLTLQGI